MARVSLRGVKKVYAAAEVIKGIDLDIKHGEFCIFVGPSGCGKSTLLRMISGLEHVTEGQIFIGDRDVTEVSASERELAMVFQSYALYPHMSVRQNLSFGLENIRAPRAEITERVAAVAKMLQIEQLLDRRPKDLSGGQRQRVAIGRAVVREPSVFLFDEPLSNLDAELRVDMRAEIAGLHRRLENTMIYVTHDQVEAMTMADKIAVLREGRLEQFGRPLDLYNNPGNLFVAGFIGSPRMNFFSGTVEASGPARALRLPTSELVPLPASGFSYTDGQKVTLGLRPADVVLLTPGQGTISSVATSVEQLGGESYIHAKLTNGDRVTLHMPGQTRVGFGEAIGFNLPVERMHLFDTVSGQSLKLAQA